FRSARAALFDRHSHFGNFWNYARLWNACQGEWGLVWGQPTPEVTFRLRRVLLRRLRQEVLAQLPRKSYETIEVGLTAALTRECGELGEAHGELLTGGELPPFDQFSSVREKLAKGRIGALHKIVEQHEECGTPLVVFSAHTRPVRSLQDRAGWGVITGDTPASRRQRIVEDFQAGKLKGVAATIQAGGTGLTLTRASTVLFVDL